MHSAPERLSTRAGTAIVDPQNSVFLSLASVWELQIKNQLGKLVLRAPLPQVLEDERSKNALQLLPIETADILALQDLPHHHRDPFDRLLIAQARRGDFHLVTSDPDIARYEVPTLW